MKFAMILISLSVAMGCNPQAVSRSKSTSKAAAPASEENATAEFREGLAAVKIGGKWGFIDKSGQFVIEPQFSSKFSTSAGATVFSEGLAPAAIDGKWGFIDKTGKFVIAPAFEAAYPFSEGLAVVGVKSADGYKEGFIDKNGKTVIEPQLGNFFGFKNGLAFKKIANEWGYIDKTGNYVWKFVE